MKGRARLLSGIMAEEIVDVSSGMLVYVFVSTIFGKTFNIWIFLAAVVFSDIPDVDYIPFFLGRKKYGWTSHWFIHYPLLWILIAAVVSVWSGYWAFLLGACSFAHLGHDARSDQGMAILWPFSKIHYRWRIWFQNSEEDYQRIHSERRKKIQERSAADEIEERVGEKKISREKILLFLLSCVSVLAYIFAI